ncbi:1-phosphatidylinositol phosphodiesterase-like [Mytilus californianus]|uniref:1-phosphatidylinositol phosphodiesterase-like n=1 Tax=Mytilus californianus TaxID=6549 RepID=UPI002245E45C|nr:1-phosphatidylinositol phosphodiesterase-like [Mytilus californianus]XP_052087384.1 1-phosphatidylinositol phosphodiesterase-like [Mytilus californianus]
MGNWFGCCGNAQDDDYWNVTHRKIGSDNPDWMSKLQNPDRLSLAGISIPGTHDTMARTTFFQCAWCQSLSLPDQLLTGIRYLDLRCRYYRNDLLIYHGCCYQDSSLRGCLLEMKTFLRTENSRNECLLVRVKRDDDVHDGNPRLENREFCELFRLILGQVNDEENNLFWLEENIPTLDVARGKIVILRNFDRQPEDEVPLGIPYGTLRIEDNYAQNSYSQRFEYTRNHLLLAQEENNLPDLFLTHSSAVICKMCPPRESARRLNPMLYNFINEQGGRLGIIAMDYPGPGLIKRIIQNNLFS